MYILNTVSGDVSKLFNKNYKCDDYEIILTKDDVANYDKNKKAVIKDGVFIEFVEDKEKIEKEIKELEKLIQDMQILEKYSKEKQAQIKDDVLFELIVDGKLSKETRKKAVEMFEFIKKCRSGELIENIEVKK